MLPHTGVGCDVRAWRMSRYKRGKWNESTPKRTLTKKAHISCICQSLPERTERNHKCRFAHRSNAVYNRHVAILCTCMNVNTLYLKSRRTIKSFSLSCTHGCIVSLSKNRWKDRRGFAIFWIKSARELAESAVKWIIGDVWRSPSCCLLHNGRVCTGNTIVSNIL